MIALIIEAQKLGGHTTKKQQFHRCLWNVFNVVVSLIFWSYLDPRTIEYDDKYDYKKQRIVE